MIMCVGDGKICVLVDLDVVMVIGEEDYFEIDGVVVDWIWWVVCYWYWFGMYFVI